MVGGRILILNVSAENIKKCQLATGWVTRILALNWQVFLL